MVPRRSFWLGTWFVACLVSMAAAEAPALAAYEELWRRLELPETDGNETDLSDVTIRDRDQHKDYLQEQEELQQVFQQQDPEEEEAPGSPGPYSTPIDDPRFNATIGELLKLDVDLDNVLVKTGGDEYLEVPAESGRVAIYVEIVFGTNPQDTSWFVADEAYARYLAKVPFGAYPPNTRSVRDVVLVDGGRDYFFVIADRAGDGLAGDPPLRPPGTFEVALGPELGGYIIASGAGDFGANLTTAAFFVPCSAGTTCAPTFMPTLHPTNAPVPEGAPSFPPATRPPPPSRAPNAPPIPAPVLPPTETPTVSAAPSGLPTPSPTETPPTRAPIRPRTPAPTPNPTFPPIEATPFPTFPTRGGGSGAAMPAGGRAGWVLVAATTAATLLLTVRP